MELYVSPIDRYVHVKVHEAPLQNIYGKILVPLQVATRAKKQKNGEQIPVQSPFCIKLAPRKCFATEYVLPFRIMF